MSIDIDELELVARAASVPTKWHVYSYEGEGEDGHRYSVCNVDSPIRDVEHVCIVTVCHHGDEDTASELACHVATFCPLTALALLAELRAARAVVEAARGQAPDSETAWRELFAALAAYDEAVCK